MTIKDGLDSDGDIVLSRSIETTLGGKIVVRDILPLIKGGFTSSNGFTYTNNAVGDIAKKIYGAVNITFHQGESSSDNKFFRTRSIVLVPAEDSTEEREKDEDHQDVDQRPCDEEQPETETILATILMTTQDTLMKTGASRAQMTKKMSVEYEPMLPK